MSNKEVQRQRMMGYFIDAAKKIIEEEGIKGLTARNVGKKAGYSYATIYNYFEDLNELLTYCTFDYLEDCYKYIMSLKKDEKDSKEVLLNDAMAYFRYFISNPDIFKLIYLEDFKFPPREIMKKGKRPSLFYLLRNNLNKCAEEGYIEEENIELLEELIKSSIHGKLLLLLKGRNPKSLEEINNCVKKEIEFLIDRCK